MTWTSTNRLGSAERRPSPHISLRRTVHCPPGSHPHSQLKTSLVSGPPPPSASHQVPAWRPPRHLGPHLWALPPHQEGSLSQWPLRLWKVFLSRKNRPAGPQAHSDTIVWWTPNVASGMFSHLLSSPEFLDSSRVSLWPGSELPLLRVASLVLNYFLSKEKKKQQPTHPGDK